MRETQTTRGNEVRLIHPSQIVGRLKPRQMGVGKWLGYFDRFVLFRLRLRAELAWADVVHLCDQADAMYVPWLRGKPHILTCNDMLAVMSAHGEIPQNPTRPTGRLYQSLILKGLQQAQKIVCISEKTREDVLRIAGSPPESVEVILLSLNYPYKKVAVADATTGVGRLRGRQSQPFFVHVGGNQWYKNRSCVIRIFAAIRQLDGFSSHQLVMVGQPFTREMTNLLDEFGLRGCVREVLNATDEELEALYSTAEALIFPSLYEGFGWPVIEAQACECPVFTSNRPPLTEAGGRAAVYFDPDDPVTAALIVADGLQRRDVLQRAGLANLARFSREEMSEKYHRAYQSVIKTSTAASCR